MAATKRVFSVQQNGRHMKKLVVTSMDNLYKQYNTYCKGKGFTTIVDHHNSVGQMAWANNKGEILYLVPVTE